MLLPNCCSSAGLVRTQYQAGGDVADRSTPTVTCTGAGAGVGVGATLEDAFTLADVDGEAEMVGDGVGATGSASHQSWKWPVWPSGAKYAKALPSGDHAGEA